MTPQESCSRLSNDQLLTEVKRLAALEREVTADLIRALREVETRQLHLAVGCSSMFTYCTEVLHLSEHAAYARIAAARTSRRFPTVLKLLEHGAITLTTVTLLGPHLTDENHADLLESTRHKSKHDVEVIVAGLRSEANGAAAEDPLPAIVRPIAPGRYTLHVTISADTLEKLHRAKDLLRHAKPSGGDATVIDRALTVLIERLEKTKFAHTDRPRHCVPGDHSSRHVPAAVRRAVSKRDGFRCAFVGAEGRCGETGFLEYHHRIPFAEGGPTTVENIELRCRAHNAFEATQWFGPLFVREVGVSEWNSV